MSFAGETTKTQSGWLTGSRLGASTLPLFAGTMFLSALLMFGVQPMFTKMVLPRLGGSPSVWAVAMCFFQAVLLAGYAYAHLIVRKLSSPRGVIIHLAVMMLALVSLPIGLAEGWGRPPADGSSLWLLGLFAVSVGLPFFAISGNAPLMQAWFAKTGHKHASDPYFLYGASNIGSLLALLSYPILVEPFFALSEQSGNWSMGYSFLVALVGLSGMLMLVQRAPAAVSSAATGAETHARSERPSWTRRLSWIGLAFVPSGLLVAVTTHISTDVAAAPFLWVVPLSLFLLTFIIAFQHKPVIPHKWMLAAQPVLVAVMLVATPLDLMSGYLWASLGLNLLVFFVLAMVCHGELIRKRPSAGHLTEFYLWMSFGGMLGGLFTGLIAPVVFSSVVEYPLLILASVAARPGLLALGNKWGRELALAAALLFAVLAPKLLFGYEMAEEKPLALMIGLYLLGGAIALSREYPARLALLGCVMLLATQILPPKSHDYESIRGFFGVNKVMTTSNDKFRLLIHGTTIHGAQKIDASGRPLGEKPEPLTYYHRGGPFADVIRTVRAKRPFRNVAAVGLGTGSLACYKRDGENWTFFEIDPIVARVARDPARFTFLSNCAPQAPVILGDARLTLSDQQGAAYDMLFLDAFSSDAIPVHLLTLEAIRSYLDKMAADGVLLFHISNRHMNLAPVLSAAAGKLGLAGRVHYPKKTKNMTEHYLSDSFVVVLARSGEHLAGLGARNGWQELPKPASRAWTDDFSDVLGAIFSKAE